MTVRTNDEQAFLNRLTEITEANLTNDQFGVNKLARELGMSRSYVHRRLKSITNQSISQFICSVRLNEAMKMLEQNEASSAEIAYKVGFSSPAYFNHCFHEHFGFTPGEAKKQNLADFNSEKDTELQVKEGKKLRIIRFKKLIFAFTGGVLALLVFYLIYNSFYSKSLFWKAKSQAEKSIIVLPFKNLSTELNNQYFADGISEDILNHLTKITDFKVVSRTSAEQFRESLLSSTEIAKKMKVNYILEGSVRRQGENVRISVQLIDARRDQHLWSENYDRQVADIFVIQSDIAKSVADKLRSILSPEEIKQIEKQPTRNAVAYDYYLMGRYFWNNRIQSSLEKSAKYFEKAIEIDSNYALAYAGLADTYYARAFWGWIPREAGYEKARKMAELALQMDSNLPEAYAVLGIVSYFGYWEWEEARKLFEQALKIDSNCMVAHLYYSSLLDILGEPEKARKHINRAIELEPFFSLPFHMSGIYYYNEKNYTESANAFQRSIELEPDNLLSYKSLFFTLLKIGNDELTTQNLQKICALDPKYKIYQNDFIEVYNTTGINGLLKLLLKVNLKDAEKEPGKIARLYMALGMTNKALFFLEKAFQQGLTDIPRSVARNPDFDILRDRSTLSALIVL